MAWCNWRPSSRSDLSLTLVPAHAGEVKPGQTLPLSRLGKDAQVVVVIPPDKVTVRPDIKLVFANESIV